jgi:catechol 2,3-dioxygenase-like lactoylglutathione lyase family enzyme
VAFAADFNFSPVLLPIKLLTLQVMLHHKKHLCIILLLFGGLIVSNAALSQTNQGMRPSLVAIQVDNLDNSIAWYKDYLGFSVLERKEFKEYGMSISILELHDFKLELVDNEKALNKNSVLKKNEANDMTGFAKITFTIDHVDSLYATLKSKGASFAITLRDSNINPREEFFIVLDCDNNWLQFIGFK